MTAPDPADPSNRADRAAPAHPESQPAGNLPAPLSSFIGRDRELAETRRLLDGTRLLTLTGAGGVGKSRLALELARAVAGGDYPDGAWLVELAALADGALVPEAAARALGALVEPGQPPTEALAAWLRDRSLLLILDNCEHLLDACARLAEALLRAAPDLRILATSRQPLGMAGETAWRVPSLSLPAPDGAGLAASEAARLFVARAVAAHPGFAVTGSNAAAVAEVCLRLDGIPLALELAAARVAALTVEQLAARLDDRFRLLTGGSRTALPRQQTLRATLDWSHGLLTQAERTVLRRLAVFAGGWTLEAAEAVCAGGTIEPGAVLDLLARLVDRSLAQAEDGARAAMRYRLLETVRQYARERLDEAGEEQVTRDRHRDWCLALAEQAEPALEGRTGGYDTWVSRLEAEQDNLRAALAWSLDTNAGAGLRLAGCIAEFWRMRRRNREGGQWLEALLARAPEWTAVQARALYGAGRLYREMSWAGDGTGALTKARDFLTDALTRFEELGERWGMAQTLSCLGLIAAADGDEDRARELQERSAALCRNLGDRFGLAMALDSHGLLAIQQGDYGGARALLAEGTALLRALSEASIGRTDRLWRSVSLQGVVARLEGDYRQARALLEEARMLADATDLTDPFPPIDARIYLGDLARSEGDEQQARALYRAALARCHDLEWRRGIAHVINRFGFLAIQHGALERGVRLIAVSTGGSGLPSYADHPEVPRRLVEPPPREREAVMAAARAALGEAAFAAAWAEGQALTLEQALAEALADEPASQRRTDRPGTLTPREAEVAGLVARGLTNRQIAAELVISRRTAERHLINILNKLGFATRVQVATWAVEQGLAAPSRRAPV